MKRRTLIKILLIAVGIFLLFFAFKIVLKNGESFISSFEGRSTKDDNFKGPGANDHLNDRDEVFNSLAVSPTNPDIVFIGTENNALLKSTDRGENWQWIRKGFWHNKRSHPEFYDIAIDSDNENIMYATLTNGPQTPDIEKSAGFYRSQDNGESWERFIEGLPNTAITSVAIVSGSSKKNINRT